MRQASPSLALLTALALLARVLPLAAQPTTTPEIKPPAAPAETPEPLPLVEQPDPPGLVGRVARLDGSTTYRLPGQEEWQPAQLNFPIATGHALWTGAEGRAGLQLGSLRLALEAATRLDFAEVADAAVQLTLAQGLLYVALPPQGPALELRVTTPRGDARLARPGRYLVQAGAEDRPTRITVLAGSAAFAAEGLDPVAISPGEALAVSGLNPLIPSMAAAEAPPPLVAWAQGLEPRQPLPQAVQGMTGADDLSRYGDWQQSEEYGDLWLPPVAQDWVPYRQGRWSYLQPWGWTWVDDAPWGFAPFHYGRWVEWNNRWAWAPGAWRGYDYWPVYAPALVYFFPGIRPGWLGWAPLRPWHAYHPPFWASSNWFRHANTPHLRNLPAAEAFWRQNRQAVPPGSFLPRAATLVPNAAMAAGRPVAPAAQPMAGPHNGPVHIGPALAPALALGAAGLLAPRALQAGRPPLPAAVGPRMGGLPQVIHPPGTPPYRPQGQGMPAPGAAPGFAPNRMAPGPAPAPNFAGKPGGGGGFGGTPPGGFGGGGGFGQGHGKPGGGFGGAPPAQRFGYNAPAPHYSAPAQRYSTPMPHYAPPAPRQYSPAPQYSAPQQRFSQPAPQYAAPAQRYSAPAPHFSPPQQSFRAAPSAPSRPSAPSSPPRGGGGHHHR